MHEHTEESGTEIGTKCIALNTSSIVNVQVYTLSKSDLLAIITYVMNLATSTVEDTKDTMWIPPIEFNLNL